MRNVYSDSEPVRVDNQVTPIAGGQAQELEGLPNRLLTAFEVAEFVGCHEETVRRGDPGDPARCTNTCDVIHEGSHHGGHS